MSAAAARMVGALAAVLALAVLAPASADAAGFVTRSGDQLVLDGSPYRFTGFNIYNANSDGDCGPAMSTGPALDESLAAIGAGSNAFRSWFFQSLATTDGVRDWSAFDHTLAVARSRGFRVIATLTNQYADCEAPDGFKDETWYTTGYRALDPAGIVSYRDWVAEVVNRYKDDPTILVWQLVNEAAVKSGPGAGAACSANAAQLLKSFTTDVSGLVKSIDLNHLVSLGTIGTGQCGAEGAEYQDLHDVPTIDLCEYHDYGEPDAPMPGDEFNGLAVRIDQCDAIQKPIFVGETGIVPNDTGGTLAARAAAFDAKFAAQFGAGVVGELVWTWSTLGSRLDDFEVGAGDPTIAVLGSYAIVSGEEGSYLGTKPLPQPPPPPAVSAVGKPAKSKLRGCRVPKLRRLTVKRARTRLKRAGCRYRFKGHGKRVRSTTPRAGRRTTKRVIVRLARRVPKNRR